MERSLSCSSIEEMYDEESIGSTVGSESDLEKPMETTTKRSRKLPARFRDSAIVADTEEHLEAKMRNSKLAGELVLKRKKYAAYVCMYLNTVDPIKAYCWIPHLENQEKLLDCMPILSISSQQYLAILSKEDLRVNSILYTCM